MRILLHLFFCFNVFSACGQEKKYTVSNAHAHNDYEHPFPFYTAYDAGFGSIEADIFLKNDQLYVAHNRGDIKDERTLASLYLDPLQKVINNNKGYVYSDSLKKLILLVDLKTPAESTLEALLKLLLQYKSLTDCGSLKIVITGNQPDASKLLAFPSYIFFDGRLNQNYSQEMLKKIALFSDNFRKYSSWKGEGVMDANERQKIEEAVSKAHALGKPIRFWASPDVPDAWKELIKLKIDFINTDKIEELSMFLK